MTNILNDSTAGNAMIKKGEELEANHKRDQAIRYENFDLKLLLDDKTSIVTISAERETIGTITDVNAATTNMFGRLTSELVGSNITILIPEPFSVGDRHDQYLLGYIDRGIIIIMLI